MAHGRVEMERIEKWRKQLRSGHFYGHSEATMQASVSNKPKLLLSCILFGATLFHCWGIVWGEQSGQDKSCETCMPRTTLGRTTRCRAGKNQFIQVKINVRCATLSCPLHADTYITWCAIACHACMLSACSLFKHHFYVDVCYLNLEKWLCSVNENMHTRHTLSMEWNSGRPKSSGWLGERKKMQWQRDDRYNGKLSWGME